MTGNIEESVRRPHRDVGCADGCVSLGHQGEHDFLKNFIFSHMFFKNIYFNWRVITLQYCDGFGIYRLNQPPVHICPPILNSCPPPSPPFLSGLSQSTGFECAASFIELALVIYFTYSNIHVSILFSQIIPPSPSPTESKSLFCFATLHIRSLFPSF